VSGPHGTVAIVEIVKRATPFGGPPMSMRVSPEHLTHALLLAHVMTVDVGEYFYLQLFEM